MEIHVLPLVLMLQRAAARREIVRVINRCGIVVPHFPSYSLLYHETNTWGT